VKILLKPSNYKTNDFYKNNYRFSWISNLLNHICILLNINPSKSCFIVFGILPMIPLFIAMYFTSYYKIIYKIIIGEIPYQISLPSLLAYS
jgi:hypothetical protein